LLVLGGIGQALLARSLDHGVTSSLRDVASEEIDHLRETGDITRPLDSDVPSRSAMQVEVYRPNGRPARDEDTFPSWLRPQRTQVSDITVAGEPVRLLTIPATKGGNRIATIVAGRSLVPQRHLIHPVR